MLRTSSKERKERENIEKREKEKRRKTLKKEEEKEQEKVLNYTMPVGIFRRNVSRLSSLQDKLYIK